MKELILKKKIPAAALTAVLYLSFCMSGYFARRGSIIYTFLSSGGASFFTNGFVVFLMSGIAPMAFYEIITVFVFRQSAWRLGESARQMRYALRYFYIAANLLGFALSFLYFVSPVFFVYGGVFFEFLAALPFFIGFLFFAAKHYTETKNLGIMTVTLCGSFLISYAAFAVMGIFI